MSLVAMKGSGRILVSQSTKKMSQSGFTNPKPSLSQFIMDSRFQWILDSRFQQPFILMTGAKYFFWIGLAINPKIFPVGEFKDQRIIVEFNKKYILHFVKI
jgi:hypothetical protein